MYDDLDINEKQMTKDDIKKDQSPLAPLDPILRYVEAFQEGHNWVMPPNPHIPS
jgi:hypothetical protein